MIEVREHLTTVLEVLEWGNLHMAQLEHYSETLLKTFAFQTNVTSSSFSSSSKLLNCVLLVLVLCCLIVYFHF